jgi:hypothetical protein
MPKILSIHQDKAKFLLCSNSNVVILSKIAMFINDPPNVEISNLNFTHAMQNIMLASKIPAMKFLGVFRSLCEF